MRFVVVCLCLCVIVCFLYAIGCCVYLFCVMVYGVLCLVVFVCSLNVVVWFVSELSCDVVWFVFFVSCVFACLSAVFD